MTKIKEEKEIATAYNLGFTQSVIWGDYYDKQLYEIPANTSEAYMKGRADGLDEYKKRILQKLISEGT